MFLEKNENAKAEVILIGIKKYKTTPVEKKEVGYGRIQSLVSRVFAGI